MKLIVAVDEHWGIGKANDLLLSIPDDMRYFREKTRGKVLVMGYNTLLSFPDGKPLPGRLNIVLNNEEGCCVSSAVVCESIEQMISLIGDFDSELIKEFFEAFVRKSEVTLHFLQFAGENSHHIAESIFKAFGRTMASAVSIDPERAGVLPSTKGML